MAKNKIYLLEQTTKSEDGCSTSWSKVAFEDEEMAFNRIRKIIEFDEDHDVRWRFSFDDCCRGECSIVGKGMFYVNHEADGKEPGIMTLTLKEVHLIAAET